VPHSTHQLRTYQGCGHPDPDHSFEGGPGERVHHPEPVLHWVPKILASPAYRTDGLLVVTFDESEGPPSDSSACGGEGPGPNSPLPGITGLGGGRVGAVVLSRWVRPGSFNDDEAAS
jgi:hypothetical protein